MPDLSQMRQRAQELVTLASERAHEAQERAAALALQVGHNATVMALNARDTVASEGREALRNAAGAMETASQKLAAQVPAHVQKARASAGMLTPGHWAAMIGERDVPPGTHEAANELITHGLRAGGKGATALLLGALANAAQTAGEHLVFVGETPNELESPEESLMIDHDPE